MKWYQLLCCLFLLAACNASKIVQEIPPTPPTTVKVPAADAMAKTEMKTKMTSDMMENIDPLPVDPDLRMGTLANGMKYYIKKNTKPENRVELRLALKAGSIMEDDDQQGLAHFVEHMAFNGSTNFKKNELVDYLESVGTKFGPDLNAYTSFDETVYMLQVRTDDKEMLDKGLLVMQDWAGGVSFDDEEIDKERGVVISEWRTRLSPDQRMQKTTFPQMYYNSRYAERLPIGKPEIIENSDYDAVKRFYKDWYRPDLMALVIVGDVDVNAMENKIKTDFASLTNPENERERTTYDVPKHKETIVSIASDEESAFTRVRLMYKHDHLPVTTEKEYRDNLARTLYNRMLGARLKELTQSENPPFTFASTRYSSDVGSLDTYSSFAFVAEGGAAKGLETLLVENERVLQHGFQNSEMKRAMEQMITSAKKAVKEKGKSESRRLSSKYVYNFLEEIPIMDEDQTLTRYEKYLPTITLDEVNALAKQWITDENRVVVVTGPQRPNSPVITESEVRSLLGDVETRTIKPYVDNFSDKPLFDKELTAQPVKSKNTIDNVDITEVVLANGVKVYLKSTDFKNDEIIMNSYSPGGHAMYGDKDYYNASYAAQIIDEAGLADFDAIQLGKLLTGKVVGASPYINESYEGMRGSCSPDDLEIMLQLTHLYFTSPRKDEATFNSFLSKEGSIYKNLMSDPRFFFGDQVQKVLYNDNLRRNYPTVEVLDKINLDRVYEIYQERFADADDFTFTFVGNFDPDEVIPMLSKYLGTLPTLPGNESVRDLGINIVDGAIDKNIKKGKAPKTNVNITYHGKYDWDKKTNYHLKSMVEVMRIKLRESMREDKGGVYGVRVNSNYNKIPTENYSITISFNSDPEMTNDLLDTALQDIGNMMSNGPEEADLTKVKETQRQELIKKMKENRFWLNTINGKLKLDEDLDSISLDNLDKAQKEMTTFDIKKAAQQFFDAQQRVQIVMEPAEQLNN